MPRPDGTGPCRLGVLLSGAQGGGAQQLAPTGALSGPLLTVGMGADLKTRPRRGEAVGSLCHNLTSVKQPVEERSETKKGS